MFNKKIASTIGQAPAMTCKKQYVCQEAINKYFIEFHNVINKKTKAWPEKATQGMHYSIILRDFFKDKPKLVYPESLQMGRALQSGMSVLKTSKRL